MRILIISTIMLIPWQAGPASAASISGINPGSNGVCAPSEREWTPCGSDFASTPHTRHSQHTSDPSGIGADRGEGIHGGRADGNRGGGNGSGHGGGHQSNHGGGGRR